MRADEQVDPSQLGQSSRFARAVSEPLDEVERLQRGVELAVELVPGCEQAGVTIVTKSGVKTEAATSDLVWWSDQLQYELSEGPCLHSVATAGTVVSNDVSSDARWPHWGPAVQQRFGVGAMLSLLLYTRQQTIGVLNLYALRKYAYDVEDIAVAQSLCAHLSVAVAASREIEQRGNAMASRTVIGQAEGILMERYNISADRAFDVLRRISQNSNLKLTAMANELVTTGHLEGLPGTERNLR